MDSVPGPLSDSVDRAFDLAGSAFHGREAVGHRHPQVIVAMHRDDRLLDVLHLFADVGDQLSVFRGGGVPYGVRDVDRGGSGVNGRLDDPGQVIPIRTGGVLGGELHILRVPFGMGHGAAGFLQNLFPALSQLVFQMNVRGGDKDMDPRRPGVFQGFPGCIDIARGRSRKAGNLRAPDLLGDLLYGLEIPGRAAGEPGFDHVHVQTLELAGEDQLFPQVHAGSGRLFSVPEGGVKDADPFHV